MLKQINTPSVLATLGLAWNAPKPEMAVFDVISRIGRALEITNIKALEIASGLSKMMTGFDSAMKVFSQTPALTALQESMNAGALALGLHDFSKAINMPVVESQNMALLKLNPAIRDAIKDTFDKGVLTSINQMYVGTAEKLSRTAAISFRKSDHAFFIESNPQSIAVISEMNIVCSGVDVLSDITEIELINFLAVLTNSPTFASSDPIGTKIFELISSWKPVISFDCEQYYHARTYEVGKAPYPADEMCKAPAGVTWHGRFNWPGKSHYYFSDQSKGALYEIEKHAKKPCQVQIATIRPNNKIKLVDLSGENKGNKFLEHCRFPMSSGRNAMRERAYLLPCFVSDCCAKLGLDGIKYYGSKEYSNYVTWKDGHFGFVSQEIHDVE